MKALLLRGSKEIGSTNMHMSLYNPIKKLLQFLKIDYDMIDVNNYDFDGYDIYIGFSTSCVKLQYIKKKHPDKLYISIGDKIDGTYSFKNHNDEVSKNILSESSLKAHYSISDETLIEINNIINNYIKEAMESNNAIQSGNNHYKIPKEIKEYYDGAKNRIRAQDKCGNDTFIGDKQYTFPVKDPFTCKFHCALIHAALQRAIMIKKYKVINKAKKLFNNICKG